MREKLQRLSPTGEDIVDYMIVPRSAQGHTVNVGYCVLVDDGDVGWELEVCTGKLRYNGVYLNRGCLYAMGAKRRRTRSYAKATEAC